eukprot:TRINITY_DN3087_c0_g1_i1.p1 TRINITY_DN3087_c0_g1~~TRINITY_DN3087_c0_g1_i1.p1  ORF type:complete len:89 (-),score=11.74 TRINITY_DN3087_c0_g1_i1:47-313(-)
MKGVQAQQIITFFEQYAHPRLRVKNPVIPRNVTDLIILWEKEKDRLSYEDGCLIHAFKSFDEFQATFGIFHDGMMYFYGMAVLCLKLN